MLLHTLPDQHCPCRARRERFVQTNLAQLQELSISRFQAAMYVLSTCSNEINHYY